jgi:anti-anti-sigma factor
VVRFPGNVLSAEACQGIGESLSRVVHRSGKCVLLDLAGVEYPTAGGLGKLVTLHKELLAGGSELVLCNVSREVYEVLAIARLTDVLDVRRKGDR